MKPVLIAMGALLIVMFGFAWLNGKNSLKPTTQMATDRQILISGGPVSVGKEGELLIVGKSNEGKIISFNLEIQFDTVAQALKHLFLTLSWNNAVNSH